MRLWALSMSRAFTLPKTLISSFTVSAPRLDMPPKTASFTGTITDTTNGGISYLNKTGPGTLILSGVNTYTGATTVNGGKLRMNTGNATSASITVNNGATLELNLADALGATDAKSVPIINSGGTIANITNANRVTLWNGITMTGGTLTSTGTGDANGAYSLSQTVTATSDASGNAALISGAPIGLQNRNVVGGATTFAVAQGVTAPASDLTVSSNLSSFAPTNTGITKTGNGIMTLLGANTYVGVTTVSGGRLQIGNGNGATLGGGTYAGAIVNTATLGFNSTAAQSLTGAITGAGALIKNGSGALTITNTNTLGAVTLTGGTLNLNGTTTAGATSVAGGSVLNVNATTTTGAFSVADGGSVSLKDTAAGITPLTSTSLTMGNGGATTLAVNFSGLNPSVPQISTGALSLSGLVSLNLTGTLGLTTNNYKLIKYTGTPLTDLSNFAQTSFAFAHTQVDLINNTTNPSEPSVDLSVAANTLVWTGDGNDEWKTETTDETALHDWITDPGNDAANFFATDRVEFNDTHNTSGDNPRVVDIVSENVQPSDVVFNNTTVNYRISGSVGIAGSTGLLKKGTGTASIWTPNSYTGATTINEGVLNIQHSSALGASSGVTVAGGAALELQDGDIALAVDARPLTLNGAGLTAIPAGALRNVSGQNSYAGTVNLASNSTVQVDSSTLTLSGVISGSGTLTKTGAGILKLSTATNTFSGGLAINAGTLSVDANLRLGGAGGTAGAVTLSNGATLKTTNDGRLTNSHPVTVGAGGGTLYINSTGAGGTGQVYFNVTNTLLGGGALTVTGNGTLTTTGAGNLRVDHANTYNGAITLQSGGSFEYGVAGAVDNAATIILGNEGELITASGLTCPLNVTVNGGANSVMSFVNGDTGIMSGNITLNANGTVALRDWYGNPPAAHNGTISGVISGGGGLITTRGASAGTGTLTLTAANTYSGVTTIAAGTTLQLGNGTTGNDGSIASTSGVADDGTITFNRFGSAIASYAISGSGSVVKTGAGTQTLLAANTYTGATNINAGTLVISGDSPLATGAVTVASGATLAGNGDLGGAVSIAAGGIHSLGVTPTRDIGSTLTLTAGNKLVVTAASQPANGTYDLVYAPAGITGTVAPGDITLVGITGGTVAIDGTNKKIQLTVASGSAFQTWINGYFTDPLDQANPSIVGPNADPDNDGYSNAMEFGLGGVPNSGGNSAKIYVFTDTALRMTIAVRDGGDGANANPIFTGSSPTATQDGYRYTIEGSTDLSAFLTGATEGAPISPGFAAPAGYEWRTFSLTGSSGLPNKGFLRVHVTPTP